jgi:RNase P/RNase MRP subunit p30
MDENKIISTSKLNISFVPPGITLSAAENRLILDVGNQLGPGIIDHHGIDGEKECAASLLVKYPQYALNHLGNTAIDKITFVTHIHPDFDAVTAIFLAYHFLTQKRFPPFSNIIASYTRDIDMGICSRYPEYQVTIYSIFTALSKMIRQERQKKENPKKIYHAIVVKGFQLWYYALSVMNDHTDLHTSQIFQRHHPFQKAQKLVEADYKLYLEDLSQCTKARIHVHQHHAKIKREVDALFITNPKSLLFRVWARNDLLHPLEKNGYTMLAVNYGYKRYVISTDPKKKELDLKGLGDMLEEAETIKRMTVGKERQGKSRPGYRSPDPWYDGRNSLHSYTIIDTPREGTVLTWKEIQEVIKNYSHHLAGTTT